MSQLTAPTHTVVDNIPLWLRIREIMKEQGSSYSLTAMAGRLGMSRETLRLMLSGEREIYSFELEKITQDLKIPLARLLQEDIVELKPAYAILIDQGRLEEAMELAKYRESIAIGLSEKVFSSASVAWVYFWKEEMDTAKGIIHEALAAAEEVNKKYAFQGVLTRVFVVFLNIYTHTEELDKVLGIVERLKPLLHSDPINMGVLYVALAKMKYASFENAEAKMYMYKCLELFIECANRDRIGRAYINTAIAEYADRNYEQAKELLETGKEYWENDKVRLLGLKELAKTHLKLREFQAAESLIRTALRTESFEQLMDIKASLIILLSRAAGSTSYAESVAMNLRYPKQARYHAYRHLTLVNKQEKFLRRGKSAQGKSQGRIPTKRFPLDKNF
ncbi:hypothetical protein CBW65_17925 [Tumebacillus avium]|uniref:HTH cro/C1-type domain-containing protein n=1 Tax=Tumebacillus avium TaxID=1903704 RepID=A0A1Y0IQT9_9BACL|nr:helix-turn-helix transcriptional regulator [Tumebacillus avium]ARU62640.1 hypothetical protein CBW65_17925 [Tumebacillus avium]